MRVGVFTLPLACCAIEAAAATQTHLPLVTASFELVQFEPGESFDLVVFLVAGTITRNASAEIVQLWSELPSPKVAVAYGVCASSGGPYWDSYAVVTGAAEVLPVSMHIPGCPPPAATLVPALQQLLEMELTNAD